MAKQLFEKQNEDYKKFNPIVFLKDILATDADETLAWILQNYCHFYVEWRGDAHATRLELPVVLRKHGIWITYNNSKNLITEQYVGDNRNIENSIEFADDKNWQMVNKEDKGVPIVDIKARVSEVISEDEPQASVEIENENTLAFKFSLPRGPQGAAGVDGLNGANGMDGKDGAGVQYIYLRNSGDVPANPTPADITSDEYQQKNHYKDIEYIPEGWSDDPVGVNLEEKFEWVCQRRYVNNIWGPFSNPTIWGKFGDVGPQGEVGPQGVPGESVLVIRSVMAFKTSIDKPDTPVGGVWNLTDNSITYPSGWSSTDGLAKPVWMSVGEFHRSNPANPTWSEPTCISGEDGVNGTDGVNMEFIYKLTKNDLTVPDLPTENTPTDTAPTGWTDSPTGITETEQCEWVCTRKKDSSTGNWNSWEGPTIWSKWGVNGVDGDGVEYIYKQNNGELLENPSPDNIDTDEYQGRGEYEDVEYIPAGWSDEPKGVGPTASHEWVSVRKYRNGSWGKFSNPAIWAKYGEDGYNGISIRTMYAKTEDSSTKPVFVKDNINPGSIWGLAVPNYTYPEAIWSISAYVNYKNELVEVNSGGDNAVYGWQGPILVSGIKGDAGIIPNYQHTFFKLSSTGIPAAPTFTDPANPTGGWVDYPNGTGQWYQCVAIVNGITNTIIEWGGIITVNGKDGVAKDGKHWETRFAVSSDYNNAPAYSKSARNPSVGSTIWVLVDANTAAPTVPTGGAMWQIMAEINPDNTLVSGWCPPFRISGEVGPQGGTGPAGETGPTGPTGIPGVSFDVRYCLGTETTPDGTTQPSGNSPTGWQTTLPTVTEAKPYIWCIQGKRTYTDYTDTTGTVIWQTPFKLNGTNGVGKDGKRGQLVYPAGIYSGNATYTCDENIAPYVFYPSTQKFYVLNTIMTWKGSEQTSNPSNSTAWVEFKSYDAIYANIAIVENGLIGSAVFNNEYMFSQQGINPAGGTTTAYQNFNHSDPYNANNAFRPNWCVNLATGQQWLGGGKICFNADGSGYLAGRAISWDSDGDEIRIGEDLSYSSPTIINKDGITVFNNVPEEDGQNKVVINENKIFATGTHFGKQVHTEIDFTTGTITVYDPTNTLYRINIDRESIDFYNQTLDGSVAKGTEMHITPTGISMTDNVNNKNFSIDSDGVIINGVKLGNNNIQFVSSLPSVVDDNTLYVLV